MNRLREFRGDFRHGPADEHDLEPERSAGLMDRRARVTRGHFEIEVGRDIDAFERDWRALESDGALTPFQTIAWLGPVYRVLAPRMNATPLLILLRDKQTRQPAMLLPLCVRRRHGFSFIEFADFGACDYNAPILSHEFNPTEEEWSELWNEMVSKLRGVAEVVRLQKLPRSIDNRPNPLTQRRDAEPMNVGHWGVGLPETIDAYDQEILTSTFRKELAKKTRRVAKRGAMEWVSAATAEERRALFDILARQRQARCDEMGRHNVLSEAAFRAFYDAATGDPGTASLVRVEALTVGGEIVASMLSLRHRDASHVIMTTFEGGEWKSASLGNVLIHEAISRKIADGVRFFDLTIGDEPYKRDFGAARQPLFSILRPLSLFGVGLVAAVKAVTKYRNSRIS